MYPNICMNIHVFNRSQYKPSQEKTSKQKPPQSNLKGEPSPGRPARDFDPAPTVDVKKH